MENKKGDVLTKKFWYFILGICIFLSVILGVSIYLFANRKEEVIEKNENGGQITLNYTNNVTGLNLMNITPVTDSVAIKDLTDQHYFDFFIDVDLKEAASIEYEISVIKNTKESTILDDDIRIYLEKEQSGTYTKVFGPSKYSPLKSDSKLGSSKGSMVLLKTKALKSSKDNYRLRMWLSDQSLTPSGNYSIDVVVNGVAK